jgi:hypothetical protein
VTLPHVGRDVERVADLGKDLSDGLPVLARVADASRDVADDAVADARPDVCELVLQLREIERYPIVIWT